MSFSNIMHKNSIAKKNRCTHMVILYHMVDYIVSFLPFSAGSIQNREKISICHACRYTFFYKDEHFGRKVYLPCHCFYARQKIGRQRKNKMNFDIHRKYFFIYFSDI